MVCREGQCVGTEGCRRFRWCGAVWGTMLGPEGFPPILSLPLLPLLFPVAPGGLGISSPGGFAKAPCGRAQAKRDRKRAGDHTAGAAPGTRAGALSQSQRLSGPARKIPTSCGPVSPTSPAAAGFSPAGTCWAAAGAVGQQLGECPSVGPWGLPHTRGSPRGPGLCPAQVTPSRGASRCCWVLSV